jgi:hypothetical protein
MTKKLALALALVFATTGLTFAAGQNQPATSKTTTKTKKHHKASKKNTKAPEKK